MKYTIELTENQANQLNDIMIGINASWGYASAPKLKMNIPQPMKESPAYKKGFEDGKKYEDASYQRYYDKGYSKALDDANHAMDVLKSMTGTECAECFEDCVGVDEVVCGFTVQRIVEIIKAYEEKKKAEEESIKVGDEVQFKDGSNGVIISKNKNFLRVVMHDGFAMTVLDYEVKKKTGKNFSKEVEQLLSKLKERDNEQ